MNVRKIAGAATIAAGLLLTGCQAPAVPPVTGSTGPVVPCITEDYDGPTACFWDASTRGNGLGQSFTWTGSEVIYKN